MLAESRKLTLIYRSCIGVIATSNSFLKILGQLLRKETKKEGNKMSSFIDLTFVLRISLQDRSHSLQLNFQPHIQPFDSIKELASINNCYFPLIVSNRTCLIRFEFGQAIMWSLLFWREIRARDPSLSDRNFS